MKYPLFEEEKNEVVELTKNLIKIHSPV